MEHALENDGIEKLAKRLLALGASQEELDAVKKAADDEMNEAVRFAPTSPSIPIRRRFSMTCM